jgi:hypothetical protein
MIIPIPYGKQHHCAVRVTGLKIIICEECKKPYAYAACRVGKGTDSDILWLNSAGATAAARAQAEADARDKLAKAIDPVPCPTCGWFQSNMITPARRRHLFFWHRFGLWTALFSFVLLPLPYSILKYSPDSLVANVFLRSTQVMCLGGVVLVAARFVLSQRFDPNKLPLKKRLQWGRSLAVVPPKPSEKTVPSMSTAEKYAAFMTGISPVQSPAQKGKSDA